MRKFSGSGLVGPGYYGSQVEGELMKVVASVEGGVWGGGGAMMVAVGDQRGFLDANAFVWELEGGFFHFLTVFFCPAFDGVRGGSWLCGLDPSRCPLFRSSEYYKHWLGSKMAFMGLVNEGEVEASKQFGGGHYAKVMISYSLHSARQRALAIEYQRFFGEAGYDIMRLSFSSSAYVFVFVWVG